MERGREVKVGRGVKVSVGGKVAVAVGIAACVKVSIAQAFATAVLARSSALKVGSGAGPQADRVTMHNIKRVVRYFLFIGSPCHIFTTKKVALL